MNNALYETHDAFSKKAEMLAIQSPSRSSTIILCGSSNLKLLRPSSRIADRKWTLKKWLTCFACPSSQARPYKKANFKLRTTIIPHNCLSGRVVYTRLAPMLAPLAELFWLATPSK